MIDPSDATPGSTVGTRRAPLALTFILPTRNRKDHVARAVDSCLAANTDRVRAGVLVIDGHSSDGSFEMLGERYRGDARVRLVRQSATRGFMAACLQGVALVDTPFATFMYDDDVLSPHWSALPSLLHRDEDPGFGLGFAAESHIDRVLEFDRPADVCWTDPDRLIEAYFGKGHELSARALPVNPICCLTRTSRLREWVNVLSEFASARPVRRYFMMERNAGPDFIIYLLSLARSREPLPVVDAVLAQFSVHETSMTMNFEDTDLRIGYWLAQVWLVSELARQGRWSLAGWCASYTVRQGAKLTLKRARKGVWRWTGALAAEVAALALRTLGSAARAPFLSGLARLLLPRDWRGKNPDFTRRRPLLG